MLDMRLNLLWIVATVLALAASGEERDAGERLVDDFLQNVTTMSGSFEQQLIDADNNVVEKSSGTLDIQRPGRFRWAYTEPYEQLLIADGKNVWSYDADLEQVTVKAQKETLASTPALLLGGSSDVLDDFNYMGSFTDGDTEWVRLRPKDTASGFSKVELGFTKDRLTRMLFGDNLEQTTLIALTDVEFNQPIDAQVFNFTPPAGVDVVGVPVDSAAADP